VPALLIVTAVDAECAAITGALRALDQRGGPANDVTVVVGGVGPAASAAATAFALTADTFELVVSAGIAGGFAPLATGELAVASESVFADLGAETADGFTPVSTLGFGRERYPVDPLVAAEVLARTGGRLGPILTVSTVTGSAATAGAHRARHPHAVAEAMEGAGVAAAAERAGIPFAELRAVSNPVGPRDRSAWRIDDALASLATAVAALTATPWKVS
jgi:futalosine hydrolase